MQNITELDPKVCSKCKKNKPLNEYPLSKGKHKSYCKECGRAMCRNYKRNHKQQISEYNKEYKGEHTDEIKIYNHDYNLEHRDEIQPRQTIYQRERKLVDQKFKLSHDIHVKICDFIKKKLASAYIVDILDCDYDFFVAWLTYQFTDEMTIDNYGKYWQVDHVIPCSLYDITDKDELHKCFNWSNCQPLKSIKNSEKVNKFSADEVDSHEKKVIKYKKINKIKTNEYQFDKYEKQIYDK